MRALELRPTDEGVDFRVHVHPRASRDTVGGLHGSALRVRVRAAPADGQANEAVLRCLSRALGVRAADVELRSGARGRQKWVRAMGSPEALIQRLEALAEVEPSV